MLANWIDRLNVGIQMDNKGTILSSKREYKELTIALRAKRYWESMGKEVTMTKERQIERREY
jgi:hypothetical protein